MNDDLKIGIALLEEIEDKIVNLYGDVIAKSPGSDYDVKYDNKNKQLQEQLVIAEKKLGDSQEALGYLNFLRGRLMAIKQSPFGNKAMPDCTKFYAEAIRLGYNVPLVLYYWGMHLKAWNHKEAAISKFEEILNLVGTNSELGIEAGKEIEKVKAKKNGGCFIATACYGSYDAPEVLVLRQFRDEVLLKSRSGRVFVNFYYSLSPPIAKFLESREKLKEWVRHFLISRIVKRIG